MQVAVPMVIMALLLWLMSPDATVTSGPAARIASCIGSGIAALAMAAASIGIDAMRRRARPAT